MVTNILRACNRTDPTNSEIGAIVRQALEYIWSTVTR